MSKFLLTTKVVTGGLLGTGTVVVGGASIGKYIKSKEVVENDAKSVDISSQEIKNNENTQSQSETATTSRTTDTSLPAVNTSVSTRDSSHTLESNS